MDKQASDLVERLTAAEAGSRELDAAIERRFADPSIAQPDMIDWAQARYTQSLDAALALAERVLPDHYRGPISMTVAGSGQAFIDHTDPCGLGVGAFGNTPALALCIAILKARASNPVNEGGGGD